MPELSPKPGPDQVYIGKPLVPHPDDLNEFLAQIYTSGRASNGGPLEQRLAQEIEALLQAPALLTSSGTSALTLALQAADLPANSEVITTPATFIATAAAIAASGHQVVFADIDPDTMNLSPRAVEAAITERTRAIVAVHLFGVPCDVEALAQIAQKYSLALIYDAAHAFGVELNGEGIGTYGDASAFSLHATKLLNTGEGGALTTPHAHWQERADELRNFGLHDGFPRALGLNAKMSEYNAAVGLALLEPAQAERRARAALRREYDRALGAFTDVRLVAEVPGASAGEIFYAIRVPAARRDALVTALRDNGVLPRTFTLLNEPGSVFARHSTITTNPDAVAPTALAETLCLPFHSGVTGQHVEAAARAAKQTLA